MSRVLVEIAVTGLPDGLAAARAGADRLEVSSALSVGGVSPSLGLVKSLIRETGLPVIDRAAMDTLGARLAASWPTTLTLPEQAISAFRSQFLRPAA